jgi:restriction system protein
MLPLLKRMADNEDYHANELIEVLSSDFNLTDEEKKELLPSGTQPRFNNRVHWARAYLKMAGLISSPRRSISHITQKGLEVLKDNPPIVNIAYLKRFPEFDRFHNTRYSEGENTSNVENIIETPEEHFETTYLNLRKSLAQELLTKAVALPPAFFERLVVDLLVKMGYGGSLADAGKAIGKSGDEGIDGTIKEDKLGLDIIYIQAKRWQKGSVVGRPEIQKFVGALAGQGAKKGIFITTSNFTKEAVEYSPKNETKIVLIDGEQLAQYMIDYGIGVSTVNTYELKKVDGDYFGEE